MNEHWDRKGGYAQGYNSESTLGQWRNRNIYGPENGSKTRIEAAKIKEADNSQKR